MKKYSPFFHATGLAGIGEWIMNRMRIPVTEYEQLAQQFNPVKFAADLEAEINAG
jgi:hypothetical protein